MIPAGYMLKNVSPPPGWLAPGAEHVVEVCSLSDCVSSDFTNAFETWRHNGWWLYDSVEVIDEIVTEQSIETSGMSLFYYEVHEQQWEEGSWTIATPDDFPIEVSPPKTATLIGFDITTHYLSQGPECSPLSCNHMAKQLRTNRHCLIETLDEARITLESEVFHDCEPGPYRIFAVYRV